MLLLSCKWENFIFSVDKNIAEYLWYVGTELSVIFMVNTEFCRDRLTYTTQYRMKYNIEEFRGI